MAEGRGGVAKKFLDHTTPSARTNVASRLFLIVQLPLLLLRRGVPGTHTPPWFALKPRYFSSGSIDMIPRRGMPTSAPAREDSFQRRTSATSLPDSFC